MNDEQLLRYSRQIMLPQVEFDGQQRLLEACVMIVGMGGLGAPVAMYLAAAGVGRLILCDDDQVDLSNLQRQIAFSEPDIGHPKCEAMAARIAQLNADVRTECVQARYPDAQLDAWLPQVDAVVDASDNFATRFALNRTCSQHRIPLVSGAAIRMEGQVSVFNMRNGGPCYRCLYKEDGELEQTCSENGVLAPLVGIIGSIQATETIKVLLSIGQTLNGRLLVLDALHMEWRSLTLKSDPACPVCAQHQR